MKITEAQQFRDLLKDAFPFEPTPDQGAAMDGMAAFSMAREKDGAFVLKGYAGTGKTTLIGEWVRQLWKIGRYAVLLAPTGRAAKVMALYAGREARTIHREIYQVKRDRGGGVKFSLAPNKHRNTLFLVDEASMLSDRPGIGGAASLLEDLLTFVRSGHRCAVVFIGDPAQLPPVGVDDSPALDGDGLALRHALEIREARLRQVMRQAEGSGILVNATAIRDALEQEGPLAFRFRLDGFTDIQRLVGSDEVLGAIEDSFREAGREGTAFIVRSNKRANQYNVSIRERILFLEQEVSVGDLLMVVKNNYFWLDDRSKAGFIANGDTVEVLELFAVKELYGFRFAEVKVRLVDYPDEKPLETVLLLDTLRADGPSLTKADNDKLYEAVKLDYADETSGYRKFQAIKNNRFFNALQVKFSYAMTCHKAQGGQWERVFVEQPYLPEGIDRDYLRWLYTAVTRARERLYLIGFPDRFIEGEGE